MISVPQLPDNCSTLDAALAYVAAGWYVGPCAARSKNPGSILGSSWPTRTSKDPEMVVAWFAGTDAGVFLHVGRSGAVVLDVDHPSRVPDWLQSELDTAPFHQTRANGTSDYEQRRGHYIFALDGETYGNGVGGFTSRGESGWGDVRGSNGVIIVAPSEHSDGGQYFWDRVGACPSPSDELKLRLRPANDNEVAASDQEVGDFLRKWMITDSDETAEADARLDTIVTSAQRKVESGASRHDTLTEHLAWAMDDSRAGLVDASKSARVLVEWFNTQFEDKARGKRDKPSSGEFLNCLAWAVGQARAKPQSSADDRANRVKASEADTRSASDWVGGELAAEIQRLEVEAQRAAIVDRVFNTRFLDWTDLMSDHDLKDFVIPHFLYEGDQCILYSPAGAGKSLLTLEWATKLALGMPVFGETAEPRTVLYVDQENPKGTLRDRIENFGFDDPATLETLNQRLRYMLYSDLPPLDTREGGRELVELAISVGADLVVVDTTGSMVAGEENSNDTYLNFGKFTVNPMRAAGIAGVYLDHAGKDASKGARGGSAKIKDMDCVYLLLPKSDFQIAVTREKNRSNYEGDSEIMLKRSDGPLRHELISATVDVRIDKLCQVALGLGLSNPTRRSVYDALNKAGTSVTQRQANAVAQRLKGVHLASQTAVEDLLDEM